MNYYLRGQVAKMAQINIETLIFYEREKLIPTPARTKKGYRLYPEDILGRLDFIKQAKYAGFSLEEIRQLFFAAENKQVDQSFILTLLDKKVNDINTAIKRLEMLKDTLLEAESRIIDGEGCPVVDSLLKNVHH